ncbi:MAG: hypothetical protein WA821_02030 [Anaerolineales bacterium]
MPDFIAFLTSPDFMIGLLSLLFTVLILSYAIGDNSAFRLAIHVFIGIAAGYVTAIVLLQIIANKIALPIVMALVAGTMDDKIQVGILVGIPLLLGLTLLTKASPRAEWMGRPVVAFLVGTGAAAAVAGAMLGTIYPQVLGSINVLGQNLLEGVLVLLGTVVTLAYFQFTVLGKKAPIGKRGWLVNAIALVGQAFIAITLGTLFAGVFSAALTALVDRIQSIVLFIDTILTYFLHH